MMSDVKCPRLSCSAFRLCGRVVALSCFRFPLLPNTISHHHCCDTMHDHMTPWPWLLWTAVQRTDREEYPNITCTYIRVPTLEQHLFPISIFIRVLLIVPVRGTYQHVDWSLIPTSTWICVLYTWYQVYTMCRMRWFGLGTSIHLIHIYQVQRTRYKAAINCASI